jgi:uncharacterized protein YggT (Ycf19 family)
MSGPVRYIFIAGVIYMLVILVNLVLTRVDPRRDTVAYVFLRTARVLTEPYLRVVRLFTPEVRRGSIDWSGVIGITLLFVVLQVLRLTLG